MPTEFFRPWNPRPDTLTIVDHCIAVTEDYMGQGYTLTLRQLYYQLVAADIIPNNERSYKRIGSYVSRARLSGTMDWDAIEDRARSPQMHPEWDSLSSLMNSALVSFRLPRWDDQPNYVELWVEKDALASVLRPIADLYHITLMVNRGYSSTSAMKESAERFNREGFSKNRNCHLLYLGDLDPSGEDMVRDIRDRLEEFRCSPEVRKIALTIQQVEEHAPPPNPTKVTDSRASAYIRRYGHSSWEVDALNPRTLTELISRELDCLVEQDLVDDIVEREAELKEDLERAIADIESL